MNIGERVGDYEIVEILGSGGMGQVYKVRNLLSERVEAMKILLPNLESDSGLADRFLREIKVQAALDHPDIAKLHTAMRVGNQLLMFMEFVDGVSVSKQLEGGPLPSASAAAIAAQVLDALSYAHAQGVVHRDIKPANIMVTGGGGVKLMDFGIARMQADTRLTQTGGAVGSLFYMSPEQIRGAEPDPRSDVYSLGVTLYEMVTGRRPFAGDSDYEIMSAHLQQTPPSPDQVVSGIPSDLSEIILTAIAKEPAARFQSAAAFRTALSTVFPALPASQTGTRIPGPPPIPVAVTAPPPPPPPIPVAPPPVPLQAAPQAPPLPAFAAPAPAPPPVPAAALIPPPPPHSMAMAAPKSNRGLYMAAGSIATLLVLIAAVIEGPKLMHGGSSSAAAPASSASQPAAAAPGTPAASDAAPAADSSTAAPAAPAGPSATADSAAPPATPAAPRPSASSSGWTPVGKSASPVTPAQPAPAPNQVNAAPAPQNFQAQQAPPQPAPVPQQQAPPPAPAVNREYAQLRQQFNELSIRANSASSGLQNFQQQQSRQGLGLRADIREAKTRLDYQLQEAMTQMSSGDYDGARQSMRYAQNAVETIEKFLGR